MFFKNFKSKVKCVIVFASKNNSRLLLVSQTDNPAPKLTLLVKPMLPCGARRDKNKTKQCFHHRAPAFKFFEGNKPTNGFTYSCLCILSRDKRTYLNIKKITHFTFTANASETAGELERGRSPLNRLSSNISLGVRFRDDEKLTPFPASHTLFREPATRC